MFRGRIGWVLRRCQKASYRSDIHDGAALSCGFAAACKPGGGDAECVGDGYWFLDRATKYANERQVFGRPIGQNQGIQFPLAEAFIELEAASLMRYRACELFDAGLACGSEANMSKLLAADASWEAANVCLQTHGGFGFASEYDVERKFRETRLYQVAPISTNLIYAYMAEHVLGLPKSY